MRLLLFLLLAGSCFGQNMPFHPYRKIGEKYYDLNPIYAYAKAPRQFNAFQNPKYLEDWTGYDAGSDDIFLIGYEVFSVVDGGLLVRRTAFNRYQNATGKGDPFFLKNYPGYTNFVDNQSIAFIALRSGNYKYGGSTIPAYDYGIPYDPKALQAAIKAAEKSTNSPIVKTNK